MNIPDATNRPRTPARVYWIPLAAILLATTIGAGIIASVWNDLPDPIAHHWGLNGQPDAWGPLLPQFLFAVGFTIVLPASMIGLGAAIRQTRVMGPIAAGMGAFLAVVCFGAFYSRRGLVDAQQAPNITWTLFVGAAVAVIAGLFVWWAVRDRSHAVVTRRLSATTPRTEVAPGTNIAWSGRTRISKGAVWFTAVLAVVPLGVLTVLFFTLGDPGLGAFMLLLLATMVVLCSSMLCNITIDARGVRAVSMGLIPWVRIPLEQIEKAHTATIASALGEFGGYGYRGGIDGSGSWGLITSRGEALVVQRAGKGPMYITIDDAAKAAAVVNTLILRQESQA